MRRKHIKRIQRVLKYQHKALYTQSIVHTSQTRLIRIILKSDKIPCPLETTTRENMQYHTSTVNLYNSNFPAMRELRFDRVDCVNKHIDCMNITT